MRFSVIKLMSALLSCAVLITSCSQLSDIEEIDDIELNAAYAIPLINSSASLIELLNAQEVDLSDLEIKDDGSFVFSYEKEGPAKTTTDLFEDIPTFPFALVDSFVSVPANLFPNVLIDQLNLNGGGIRFEIVSTSQEEIDFTLTIPHLKKNGQSFQVSQTIPAISSTAPVQVSISEVSLAGYELKFPENNLEMRYEAYNPNNERVLLDVVAGEGIDWTYDYMEGYWAKDVFELEQDTLEIDVFETAFDGEFSITNPTLTIELENSFGFPVMAVVNSMQMINSAGEVLNLESTLFDEGLFLNYPSLDEVNVSKRTTLTFNSSNSNIAALLNSQPKEVIYDLGVMINPNDDNDMNGFITDQGKIKASIKTEIPAEGTFRFSQEEVIDIDFDDVDEIVEGSFKLITDNGLPISSDVQFYFIDANQNKIDSLFIDDIHVLEAAAVNGNGDVMNASQSQVDQTINADRMTKIKNAKQMIVKISSATSGDGTMPVKILSTQELSVKLGVTLKVRN